MVAVTAVFTGMGNGSLFTISVFLKPLIAELGWLRGSTAFGYTAGAISAGLGGIAMGYLSDRFSPRPVVLGGALCLGAAYLLLARQTALWQFYLFYCLLGGLGTGAFYAPLNANVGNWFERHKGLALGVTTAGQALGMGVVPFVARLLISAVGWRGAYTILGIAVLALLVPLSLLVRPPPGQAAAVRAARGGGAGKAAQRHPLPPALIVLWLSVAVVFCCICMAMPMVHAVALAQDQGIKAERAAGILLLLFVGGFFGRIFFGKAADHIGGVWAYWLASAGQTALVFWFTQLTSLAALNLLAVFFGFMYGGVITSLVIALRELTPPHRRAVSLGIVMLFSGIGMGTGGFQGGFFFDLTGGYTLSFANAAGSGILNLAIVGALIMVIARRTPRPVPAAAA
jgi:MFS family permease